jgi:protein associated with RNAse G/E
MTVRVRGIYTTALTELLSDVVQASPAIQERFDEELPVEPADATATTTDDRQGVCVTGTPKRVGEIVDQLDAVGLDTFVWRDRLPRGAVYAGEVTETLGGGALVECGESATDSDGEDSAHPLAGETVGFLPYSKTDRHLDVGDTLQVQVDELRPPWSDGRHVLETTVSVRGELGTLVRGHTSSGTQPELAEILPTDPPEGWGINWSYEADDADLDALSDCLDALSERAGDLEDALDDAKSHEDSAPEYYWAGEATCWVWFGRESRFALDDVRRDVVSTMHGHHRTKAATSSASTAVDFVEALCDDCMTDEDQAFPFDVVTDQFGPREGESLHISHGKPDGRLFDLGAGEVTKRTGEGEVTLKRELSGGGTYDALGVEKQAGDVAITKFKEGRWWYPTVYRGDDGETRGTYVNICTPVEVFPEEVRYVDLHVDVIKHADGTVERVDDDELGEAVEAGHIPTDLASKARTVAEAVSNAF